VPDEAHAPADAVARRARIDDLVDIVVGAYAPVTAKGLAMLVARLRYGVPQWRRELPRALDRGKQRLAHVRVDGVDWYWPPAERATRHPISDTVRLLAPFDPIVWDRHRFELLWRWTYRFEAYTPLARRKLGYYALPLLWRDRVIGWGNVSIRKGVLDADIGYVEPAAAREPAFRRELDLELDRMRAFLGLSSLPALEGLDRVEQHDDVQREVVADHRGHEHLESDRRPNARPRRRTARQPESQQHGADV
jgi:uncharacterized protein